MHALLFGAYLATCIPCFIPRVKRVTRHVEWAGFRQFFASKDYCKLTFLMLGCMDKSQWIMFEALVAAWTKERRFKTAWPAIYWKEHCVQRSVSINFQCLQKLDSIRMFWCVSWMTFGTWLAKEISIFMGHDQHCIIIIIMLDLIIIYIFHVPSCHRHW